MLPHETVIICKLERQGVLLFHEIDKRIPPMDAGQELKQPFHPKVMMPVVVYIVHADIVKLFLRKTAVRLGKEIVGHRSPLIAGDRS